MMADEKSWAASVFELVSQSIDQNLILSNMHDPEKITAYHEAGHAVIDLYNRIPPDGATIIPNENENEDSWFLVKVDGEEGERTFYLRKNDRTIYELITENNRWKSRRNDYRNKL